VLPLLREKIIVSKRVSGDPASRFDDRGGAACDDGRPCYTGLQAGQAFLIKINLAIPVSGARLRTAYDGNGRSAARQFT